ncbi:MAG: nitrogen fixation protein NifQ [Epsilonproteobacteria bacterium]|nr:nitrogen fixation protein NifQ [Campylobacterota bacterium]
MNELEIMEQKVTTLLKSYAANEFVAREMAPLVAQKSLLEQHLYQDLGFPNRFVMGRFMKTNFPALAAQKPKDILWKKYIYDTIGMVAPACFNCSDQINCFACRLAEECA